MIAGLAWSGNDNNQCETGESYASGDGLPGNPVRPSIECDSQAAGDDEQVADAAEQHQHTKRLSPFQ
jgi:hypothetical protein